MSVVYDEKLVSAEVYVQCRKSNLNKKSCASNLNNWAKSTFNAQISSNVTQWEQMVKGVFCEHYPGEYFCAKKVTTTTTPTTTTKRTTMTTTATTTKATTIKCPPPPTTVLPTEPPPPGMDVTVVILGLLLGVTSLLLIAGAVFYWKTKKQLGEERVKTEIMRKEKKATKRSTPNRGKAPNFVKAKEPTKEEFDPLASRDIPLKPRRK